MKNQLALGFNLKEDATFSNFYENMNEEVISSLKNIFGGELFRLIYIHGAGATGKSHLLQAVCHLATEHGENSVYVPLEKHNEMSPLILEGLESVPIICLDDIDSISGKPLWEEAVFHLFNRAKENNSCIIVSSKFYPHHLPLQLLDLKSRLSWGVSYYLNPISADGKITILQLKAKIRGFTLSDSVAKFMLTKGPHDLRKLFNVLEKIDSASLQLQRRVTIPLVKEVLAAS